MQALQTLADQINRLQAELRGQCQEAIAEVCEMCSGRVVELGPLKVRLELGCPSCSEGTCVLPNGMISLAETFQYHYLHNSLPLKTFTQPMKKLLNSLLSTQITQLKHLLQLKQNFFDNPCLSTLQIYQQALQKYHLEDRQAMLDDIKKVVVKQTMYKRTLKKEGDGCKDEKSLAIIAGILVFLVVIALAGIGRALGVRAENMKSVENLAKLKKEFNTSKHCSLHQPQHVQSDDQEGYLTEYADKVSGFWRQSKMDEKIGLFKQGFSAFMGQLGLQN